MTNLAILASGSGSNAKKIMEFFTGSSKVRVALVITNNADAGVISKAESFRVPVEIWGKDMLADPESQLHQLKDFNIDFIALAGYLKKIDPLVIEAYPKRIVNIHPALLPKHGGKGMYGMHVHRAVVEAGEKKSGMTIHYVNNHYDEGGIIFQKEVLLDANMSAEDVAAKVLSAEHAHYAQIIEECIHSLEDRK
jgi:phosphoribosylglycinamide formyltransferase-1